jgi:thymidylate synthase ThyX
VSYAARVVADSIGPHGVRITSIVITFPRFILAELNTHRVFSRNSASSRAIPPEILIERVRSNPFVPESFRARVKGMGQGEELQAVAQEKSRQAWIAASVDACEHAEFLVEQEVSKAHVNRLLEPFLWHTALITSTEWSNFFALRQPDNDDPVPQYDHGAQPEFQIIARMMRDAIRDSTPEELEYGEWHLPFVSSDERASSTIPEDRWADEYWANVSAGRCFVISYDLLDQVMDEPHSKGFERSERGRSMGHWSPLEHPAVCCRPRTGTKCMADDRFGNFIGWRQLRKHYPNEDDYSKLL